MRERLVLDCVVIEQIEFVASFIFLSSTVSFPSLKWSVIMDVFFPSLPPLGCFRWRSP